MPPKTSSNIADLHQIKEIIRLMKEECISHLEMPGVSITISPLLPARPSSAVHSSIEPPKLLSKDEIEKMAEQDLFELAAYASNTYLPKRS
jgi:hypothetical protein